MKELSPDEIRSFQQQRGLNITGIIDDVTARALEEARWKLGDRSIYLQETPLMRGDDVATLQSRLTEMGFDCGRVDGIFGLRTESAVKEFQRSAGITQDGKCGPATIIALLRLSRIVSGGLPSVLRESAVQKNRGPALANKVIVLDPAGGEDQVILHDFALRTEGRVLARHAQVAHLGNHPAAGQRKAVDRRNHRLGNLDALVQAGRARTQADFQFRRLFQIHARAERLVARASNNGHTQCRVGFKAQKGIRQLLAQRQADGIQALGTIERDQGNLVADFVKNFIGHGSIHSEMCTNAARQAADSIIPRRSHLWT